MTAAAVEVALITVTGVPAAGVASWPLLLAVVATGGLAAVRRTVAVVRALCPGAPSSRN